MDVPAWGLIAHLELTRGGAHLAPPSLSIRLTGRTRGRMCGTIPLESTLGPW
eukprot:SAG31_NODE_41072_length_277_cov_10.786517_1_plen_51_part_01